MLCVGGSILIMIFKKFVNRFKSTKAAKRQPSQKKVVKVARAQHQLSRDNISQNALKVLYRLKKGEYEGYLVGGGVRDLLLGLQPKDFDIVTNALPEEVKKLFSNCRLIGRRFRLAHIYFYRDIIELATFRGKASEEVGARQHSEKGVIIRDNVYGTLEEDVWRRDFTVNALYYNISDFSIIDYTGGLRDLKRKVIRVIGDPKIRYQEDPVRMLRAVRLAAKLNFTIDEKADEAIHEMLELIEHVSEARLFDEYVKLFFKGSAYDTFVLLQHYNLFGTLFPQARGLSKNEIALKFISIAMKETDKRLAIGKHVNYAFLLAVILWPALQEQIESLKKEGLKPFQANTIAMDKVLDKQRKRLSVPRHFAGIIRDIWILQYRLSNPCRRRVDRLMTHQRFRAAYDFLLLRGQSGEPVVDLGRWWKTYLEADVTQRQKILKKLAPPKRKPRRKR